MANVPNLAKILIQLTRTTKSKVSIKSTAHIRSRRFKCSADNLKRGFRKPYHFATCHKEMHSGGQSGVDQNHLLHPLEYYFIDKSGNISLKLWTWYLERENILHHRFPFQSMVWYNKFEHTCTLLTPWNNFEAQLCFAKT